MFAQHPENLGQPGSLTALHIVEEVRRSLAARLVHLRIKEDRIHVRPVRLARLTEPPPLESNACALHIALRRGRKLRTADMRPTSLWLIAAHEDSVMVLASGSGAWEYRRLELAQALEKMRDVLATV